jgi:glutamate---cysteine ligase / carboxylate-amine ligase
MYKVMATRYTLGIEEEFQMVDRCTGLLRPCIETILEKGAPIFGEQLKPEQHQCMVELISDILPDIPTARQEMRALRVKLALLLQTEGLALISAGTHPAAFSREQPITPYEHYAQLEAEFQDITRNHLIFGLHIHIGVEGCERAVSLMNQLRSWLPQLLALSTNSPFWAGGQLTGIKSYRSVIWNTTVRTGIPEVFQSWRDLDTYTQTLVQLGCIEDGKKIWWDIRLHSLYPTIEFRVFDMPATFEDMIALVALCQALVAKLDWLYERGKMTRVLPTYFIVENKWRAMRWGLGAEVFDFVHQQRLSMRQSIHELLDFVDDVLDDLGSRNEMAYLRALLTDPRGTGVDRQIALYQQTGSIDAVIHLLMQQSMHGIGT